MVTKYFSVWVELIRNQIPEVLLLYSLKNNTTEFLSKIETFLSEQNDNE